jgi:hypothetical protein
MDMIDAGGGLSERELLEVRRRLGLKAFDAHLDGWAIVEAPGARWLGRVCVEFYEAHHGRVRRWVTQGPKVQSPAPEVAVIVVPSLAAPPATEPSPGKPTETEERWDELLRVMLQPAFAMTTPAHALVGAVNEKGARYVGSAFGEVVYPSEVSNSFHPVRQLAVTSIQRTSEMTPDLRRKLFGYVADALLGHKHPQTGERGN